VIRTHYNKQPAFLDGSFLLSKRVDVIHNNVRRKPAESAVPEKRGTQSNIPPGKPEREPGSLSFGLKSREKI
jgi:hypothetical protein